MNDVLAVVHIESLDIKIQAHRQVRLHHFGTEDQPVYVAHLAPSEAIFGLLAVFNQDAAALMQADLG